MWKNRYGSVTTFSPRREADQVYRSSGGPQRRRTLFQLPNPAEPE
jgi:hypothetical protein